STDLRAREAGAPDVVDHLAERLRLLERNDEVTGVAADHLVPGESRDTLARIIEEQDSCVLVEDTNERHRRLRQDLGELVAEKEVRRPRHRRGSPRSPRVRAWSFPASPP